MGQTISSEFGSFRNIIISAVKEPLDLDKFDVRELEVDQQANIDDYIFNASSEMSEAYDISVIDIRVRVYRAIESTTYMDKNTNELFILIHLPQDNSPSADFVVCRIPKTIWYDGELCSKTLYSHH